MKADPWAALLKLSIRRVEGLVSGDIPSDAQCLYSFHVGNPEGIHDLLHLFSSRGTPQSIRHINAYSGHTYKFTKEVTLKLLKTFSFCVSTPLTLDLL
ncbi:catalase-domain-containing protein [Penicillium herquei]|nr:catalase-domain-containing protein [Penicillium herquei]